MEAFIKELKKILVGHGLDENKELRDELIALVIQGIPIKLDPDSSSITCGNIKYQCDGSRMGTNFVIDDIVIPITAIEISQALPMAVPQITVKMVPQLKEG